MVVRMTRAYSAESPSPYRLGGLRTLPARVTVSARSSGSAVSIASCKLSGKELTGLESREGSSVFGLTEDSGGSSARNPPTIERLGSGLDGSGTSGEGQDSVLVVGRL